VPQPATAFLKESLVLPTADTPTASAQEKINNLYIPII